MTDKWEYFQKLLPVYHKQSCKTNEKGQQIIEREESKPRIFSAGDAREAMHKKDLQTSSQNKGHTDIQPENNELYLNILLH